MIINTSMILIPYDTGIVSFQIRLIIFGAHARLPNDSFLRAHNTGKLEVCLFNS